MTRARLAFLSLLAIALPACAPAEAPRSTPITEAPADAAGRPPMERAPRAIATH